MHFFNIPDKIDDILNRKVITGCQEFYRRSNNNKTIL